MDAATLRQVFDAVYLLMLGAWGGAATLVLLVRPVQPVPTSAEGWARRVLGRFYVLGVTCGNDVSARDWQTNDIQWWRAKGHDTFGPVGPIIVAGLNNDDLLLRLRLNGEVKQEQRTKDLLYKVAEIVSWASQHVTLEPGDLIFTGTPGVTSAMKPGDIVEVELEGVGVLRNPCVAED